MLKKVIRTNRKRPPQHQQSIDDLILCLSLVREALQTKRNPRTQGLSNSGASKRSLALSYGNYATDPIE